MYIVAVGAPFEQQTFYGPFPTFDDAAEYADEECGNEYTWIVSITPPEE